MGLAALKGVVGVKLSDVDGIALVTVKRIGTVHSQVVGCGMGMTKEREIGKGGRRN